VTLVRRVWAAVKVELKVGLQTFGVAWLLFTLALLALTLATEARGFRDVVGLLTVGVVICAVYAFWPALSVAACRGVYRILGVGAYVGAFLCLLGVVTCFVLFRNVLFSMFIDIFEAMTFSGPCGAHAAGLAIFCLAAAVLGSPGSWWALLKLLLALSGMTLLGCVPGVLLWLALIARKVARLASTRVSR
jgi:hypothetical protein